VERWACSIARSTRRAVNPARWSPRRGLAYLPSL
jgi:hypothetical protein